MTDADRVVQLVSVLSTWADNRESLERKGVISKEETEQLDKIFQGSQKVGNMKEHLAFLSGVSRQVLKNQPAMDLIQKITGHVEFQNLQFPQKQ